MNQLRNKFHFFVISRKINCIIKPGIRLIKFHITRLIYKAQKNCVELLNSIFLTLSFQFISFSLTRQAVNKLIELFKNLAHFIIQIQTAYFNIYVIQK